MKLKQYLELVTYCDSALLKVTCHNVRGGHHCQPLLLALCTALIRPEFSCKCVFIQVVCFHNDPSSLMQRCIFCEERREADGDVDGETIWSSIVSDFSHKSFPQN